VISFNPSLSKSAITIINMQELTERFCAAAKEIMPDPEEVFIKVDIYVILLIAKIVNILLLFK